jgi:ribonuclease P protein component
MTGGAMACAPKNERFPKLLRLAKRSQFLRVQQHGLKVWSHPFVVLVLRNSVGVTRMGITASKRVGNAVQRCRLRRRSRELFRKKRHLFPNGLDLLLIAQPAMKEADWAFLSRAFDQLGQKLKRSFE